MASTAIGNLSIVVGANAIPFDRTMNRVRDRASNLQREFSGKTAQIAAGPQTASGGMSALGIASITAGMTAASAAARLFVDTLKTGVSYAAQIGMHAVKLAAGFEVSKIKFEVMTGSPEVGNRMLGDIQRLAIQTPFSSPQLIGSAEQLLGMGVSVNQILPALSRLGDIAGGDAERLNRLAYAAGQVNAAGRFMGTELRQFTEAGVGVADFARAAGMSALEFRARMEEGSIGASVMWKAINELTNAGGRFAGMNEKASKTVLGQWNALTESVEYSLQRIGLKLFDEFNVAGTLGTLADRALGLQGHLESLNPYLRTGADIMRDGWGTAVFVWESLELAIGKNRLQIAALIPTTGEVREGFRLVGQVVTEFAAVTLHAFSVVGPFLGQAVVIPLKSVVSESLRLIAVVHRELAAIQPNKFLAAAFLEQARRLDVAAGMVDAVGDRIFLGLDVAGQVANDWANNLRNNLGQAAVEAANVQAALIGGAAAFADVAKQQQIAAGALVGGMGAFAPMQRAEIPIAPEIAPQVQQYALQIQGQFRSGGVSPFAKFQKEQQMANDALKAKLISPDQYTFAIGNAFQDMEKVFQRMGEVHLPKAMKRGTQEAESVISRAISRTESRDPMEAVKRILTEAARTEAAQLAKLRDIERALGKIDTIGKVDMK